MEHNLNNFLLKNNNDYFLLRTKNYHKTKIKYSKIKSILNIYKIFSITDEDSFSDVVKGLEGDCKYFIVCMNFYDKNIMFVFKGWEDINDNIFTDFLEGDDKYKNDRLKILPIIYTDSKILNMVYKKNKPIIIGRKTETLYINNKKYFRININLHKSFLIRSVINGIKSKFKNMELALGITIETKDKDKSNEELFAKVQIKNLDKFFK